MSSLIEQLASNDIKNPESARENESYWKSVADTGSESDKALARKVLDMLAQAITQAQETTRNPPTAAAAVKATFVVTGNPVLSKLAGMTFGRKGKCDVCKNLVAFGSKCCGVYCMHMESQK